MSANAAKPASSRLVTTEWLQENLKKPDLVVVDGSFYLPALKRNAREEFRAGHIPGAVFFDIDDVADHTSPLPHMLPSADQFARDVGQLGIGNGDTIIVYDGAGLSGSPRVWWTFRVFGAEKVFILDGGLPKWKAEGRPLEAGDSKRPPRKFHPAFDNSQVAVVSDIQRALAQKSAQVVDARPAPRFRGEAAEPRVGIPAGHMPGAFNVPGTDLVENGRLISPDRIAQVFAAKGVDVTKPVIATCGSGVVAAAVWLALDAIGHPPQSLYDGSWTEWAGRGDLPIESKRDA